MKIFMVRWKSICEGQMLRAMKALGIDVYEWTYPGDDADYSQEALDQLSYELVKDKFDYIFSVDFFPLVARVAPVAKIPYISWSVDCPVLQYYSKTLSLPYNRIFLFDYAMYQEYLPVNPDNIFYLPLAVDQPHYDEVIATITAEDRKRFSADVSRSAEIPEKIREFITSISKRSSTTNSERRILSRSALSTPR